MDGDPDSRRRKDRVIELISGLGALFLGFGAAKYFGSVDVFPIPMFEGYEVVFLVVGGALMLVGLIHVLRRKSER